MDQHLGPASPGSRSHNRSFSFRSDKSGSTKNDLTESPREKERRDSIWKNSNKTNPNAAMNEAQPGEISLLEKTTIEPLRNYQHKDVKGNLITDPDLSNPTRPRMERPLDTIRSFEKAIDSGYKRRTSMTRAESYNDQNSGYASRRSSYYGGYNENQNRRPQLGGYYAQRDSYVDGQNRSRYDGRMQSDSAIQRPNPNGWPSHMHHQSHGTVATDGSDSTGPWANSTDPSSENSSIERRDMPPRPPPHDVIPEDGSEPFPAYNNGRPMQQSQYNQQRRPIQLTSATPGGKLPTPPKKPEPEKRQSWLKRTFSKKN